MSEYALGPWVATEPLSPMEGVPIRSQDGQRIATFHGDANGPLPPYTDPVANATLAAAAPEMLEGCRAALDRLEAIESMFEVDSYGTTERLRLAIAKATGGTS